MAKTKTHTTLANRWIAIFKGGKQTDSAGNEHDFTEGQLDELVETHQPYPMVVGHPDETAPAYGWSTKVKRVGDTVFGQYDDVLPAFDTAVKNKTYPNRSLSIFKNAEGKLQIKHIGWLGGRAPAIDGLGLAFSEANDSETFTFSMPDNSWETGYSLGTIAKMLRGLKNYVIGKEGLETADSLFPEYQIDSLSDSANSLKNSNTKGSRFSVPDQSNNGDTDMTPEEIQKIKDDAAKAATDAAEANFNQQLKNKDIEIANFKKSQTQEGIDATVDGWVESGQIAKADAVGAKAFMGHIASHEEASFDFSESDGKTVKENAVKWFSDYVGKQKPVLAINKKHVNGEHTDNDDDYEPSVNELKSYVKEHGGDSSEARYALIEAHDAA